MTSSENGDLSKTWASRQIFLASGGSVGNPARSKGREGFGEALIDPYSIVDLVGGEFGGIDLWLAFRGLGPWPCRGRLLQKHLKRRTDTQGELGSAIKAEFKPVPRGVQGLTEVLHAGSDPDFIVEGGDLEFVDVLAVFDGEGFLEKVVGQGKGNSEVSGLT